jgi:hypothetical protein
MDESTTISNILKFCNFSNISTYISIESVEGDTPFTKISPDHKKSSLHAFSGH